MNLQTVIKTSTLKKIFLPLFIIGAIFLSSCKKENGGGRHCWQLIDNAGNNLNIICDRTENELIACINNGNCGSFMGGATFTSCNYFNADGPKSCYLINGQASEQPLTEDQARVYASCFGSRQGSYVKADCLDCAFWYHREKRTYKPTNAFVYSTITRQKFCGDTLATLYPGRQIIRKDDADSLIVIQFSNNGTNW